MGAWHRWCAAVISAAGLVGAAVAQTPADPAAPLRELFLQLDANQDGVIEKEEVPPSARAAFEHLLKQGDRNHNGKIEAEEYRDLLRDLRDFAQHAKAKAIQKFQSMDRDGDGKIARDEFSGPKARFDELDKDSDGFLTRAEFLGAAPGKAFVKAAAKKKAAAPPAELLERFRSVDKNGDGKLSRDEFPGPDAQFRRLDTDGDGAVSRDELKARAAAIKKPG
jgi:Ca2+-binding EF-hand superfamily protein